MKVQINKTFVNKIKESNLSNFQLFHIHTAIQNFQKLSFDELEKTCKIKKITTKTGNEYYIYKTDLKSRIIFTIKNNILNIIDYITISV